MTEHLLKTRGFTRTATSQTTRHVSCVSLGGRASACPLFEFTCAPALATEWMGMVRGRCVFLVVCRREGLN